MQSDNAAVMTLRPGRSGRAARLATALAQLALSVGSVTYFVVGAGKFLGRCLLGSLCS